MLAFIFVFLTKAATAQTLVTNIDDLKATINAAQPGDEIIIKDGVYDGNSMTITVQGTSEAPILIRAESIGGVSFINNTKFILRTSSYVIINGIYFKNEGTAIKLEGSNNIRITRNHFELNETSSTKWVYIGGVWDEPNSSFSHHNRIDHNLFENKNEAGHYITVDGSGGVTQSQFDLIDHNHFKANKPRFSNEKESIRVGWSEMSQSSGFTTIEFNLFEECNGDPEIISVKSCDNLVRHNTFYKSEGTVSLRHGNRNRVEANYFLGGGAECSTGELGTHCSGGVRIYGEDHVVVNNYFEGLKGERWDAPITLTEGDADAGSGSLSKHFRIERAVIAYNTLINNEHGIEIGYDNSGKYSKPPRDVIIANNIVQSSSNELIKYYNQPDNLVWKNNIMFPTGTATLTNDGSAFLDDEIKVQDPKLLFDAETNTWKATSETPVYETDNSLAGTVTEDIHGDTREVNSTVGADNYSLDVVRYAPLQAEDVGPNSYHPDYDGEVSISYLFATPDLLEFGAFAESKTLEISSNTEWQVLTSESWISVDNASGTGNMELMVTVQENESFLSRSGSLTITTESLSRVISIIQEKGEVNLGGEKLAIVDVMATAEQVDANNSNRKENTLDGNFDTRWSAEGEQSITFKLKDAYLLSYLKLAFHKGDQRTTTYQVDVSMDNISFTNVIEKQSSTGLTSDFEIQDIDDLYTKFVRITGFGNSESDWNSITEVELWGEPKTEVVLNIAEEDVSVAIIYPNPAQHIINIANNHANYTNYQLQDLQGKILQKGFINNSKIVINDLESSNLILVKLINSNGETLMRTILLE